MRQRISASKIRSVVEQTGDALAWRPRGPLVRISGRAWNRVVAAILAVFGVANLFVLVPALRTPGAYDPLGDYPIQSVMLRSTQDVGDSSDADGAGGSIDQIPTLVMVTGDELLLVHAVKCSQAPNPVRVVGLVQWRLVDKPGTFIESIRGQAIRKPGCEQFDYRNPVPVAVKDRLRVLHQNGFDVSIWQLVGQETPEAIDERVPTPRLYQSQNFKVVYAMRDRG